MGHELCLVYQTVDYEISSFPRGSDGFLVTGLLLLSVHGVLHAPIMQ